MLKYLVLRALMPLAGRFPRLSYATAWAAGWAAYHIAPRAQRRVQRNLAPVCRPEQRRHDAIEVFRNVARYYVDLASLPYRDLAGFEERHITIVHEERLPALFEPGPAIVLSAHLGNPELVLAALAQRGRPFVELVEPLRPRRLSRYLAGIRRRAGGEVYETGVRGARACLDALKGGGLVALLGDRDIGGSGVCVTLCGQHVRIPSGPWELARKTGATVLPFFLSRSAVQDATVYAEDPIRVDVSDDAEADIARAAQAWAALFEVHLRRDPGQWTVLEDFWAVHACG